MPLSKFKPRAEPCVYDAEDDTHRYTVRRVRNYWNLSVRELVVTAGVRHTLGQEVVAYTDHDTLKLCAAVARQYSDLGNDYQPHEHGHRRRMTEAILRAYDADRAAAQARHARAAGKSEQ